jgi:hypothetical protein
MLHDALLTLCDAPSVVLSDSLLHGDVKGTYLRSPCMNSVAFNKGLPVELGVTTASRKMMSSVVAVPFLFRGTCAYVC